MYINDINFVKLVGCNDTNGIHAYTATTKKFNIRNVLGNKKNDLKESKISPPSHNIAVSYLCNYV